MSILDPYLKARACTRNSLDLEIFKVSISSHTFMPKYLPLESSMESSMEYPSLYDIYNIVLEHSRTP